jgi:1-pyrroline-5-carboxylate dehydrogenase
MAGLLENSATQVPPTRNEPVHEYRPNSPERVKLQTTLRRMVGEKIELPLVIGGKEVHTGCIETAVMPHAHSHILAEAHLAGQTEINSAIEAALDAAKDWSRRSFTERAAIFLKAADLLSGPWRDRLNAATMLGQSKTVHQAEIDSAAELIDFWRLNVEFMLKIYSDQPMSSPGIWNRVD